MLIRRLVESDLDELWHIRLQALTESADAFGSTYEETMARGKETFLPRLQAGDESFYLGAFDEHLIGIVGFFREAGTKSRHQGTLVSFYVVPEKRGLGTGRALVQALIAAARAIEGLEQLHLAVVTSAQIPSHLYSSLGFRRYGTEPHALKAGDRYWDEHLMVLWLH
jgi:RimJ/RimL family protein N-acetyltransferase